MPAPEPVLGDWQAAAVCNLWFCKLGRLLLLTTSPEATLPAVITPVRVIVKRRSGVETGDLQDIL
jgi:hypothetical protein